MNKTLNVTLGATALIAALTACSSTSASDTDGNAGPTTKPITASTAFTQISGKVTAATLSGTVTADNDPNHLLGRPNQYTSKVTFTDSRIKASDVEGTEKGDVERGGAIEAFANAEDAKARAEYIQSVTKSMPALAEYDYVHGNVLVRVSHYLPPAQAAEYKTATNELG
ncbi:hypothetical protein ACFZB5_13560 [Streptomyces nodosus]|uniref:hypothetical protein n=1 Tax=Streptomyces nodosus TaxID=40318 RepID=UPI0036E59618